jgi:hypothetical protein
VLPCSLLPCEAKRLRTHHARTARIHISLHFS